MYTNEEKDGVYLIYRDEKLAATYDPIGETTEYEPEMDRYAGPVGKQVHLILNPKPKTSLQERFEEANTVPVIEPKPVKKAKASNDQKLIASLKAEIADLKERLTGRTPKKKVNPRYAGIPVNPDGAPAKDPMLGDLTPDFIEWARGGGYTAQQFLQVYTGRIKDLSYGK